MRASPLLAILVVASLLVSATAGAAGPDLHAMWDDRCSGCHGHSADFARKYLDIGEDGELHGTHADRDLRTFLANHYLPESEVDAVYEMLKAQSATPPRFREQCAGCHGRAAELARRSLEVRGDGVFVRGSNESLREFLAHHRDLGAEDVEFFAQVLTRVAREVHRP